VWSSRLGSWCVAGYPGREVIQHQARGGSHPDEDLERWPRLPLSLLYPMSSFAILHRPHGDRPDRSPTFLQTMMNLDVPKPQRLISFRFSRPCTFGSDASIRPTPIPSRKHG
jgi:hypothetical protein